MDTRSLTTVIPFKKISFFTNNKEAQSSTTALGYVAHVCSQPTLNIFAHLTKRYCKYCVLRMYYTNKYTFELLPRFPLR